MGLLRSLIMLEAGIRLLFSQGGQALGLVWVPFSLWATKAKRTNGSDKDEWRRKAAKRTKVAKRTKAAKRTQSGEEDGRQ